MTGHDVYFCEPGCGHTVTLDGNNIVHYSRINGSTALTKKCMQCSCSIPVCKWLDGNRK